MLRTSILRMLTRALLLSAFLFGSAARSTPAVSLEWIKQLGTSGADSSEGISADGLGNICLSGFTTGSLFGPNAGQEDASLAKYDAAGNLQWARQLGTTAW